MIGRTWEIWPNSVRVTIGSPADMASFQSAFQALMQLPPEKISALAARPHPYPHLVATHAC
jgi:hypothetical protein